MKYNRELVSYRISLEVDENSSSDLSDEDEQEAGEVLQGEKGSVSKLLKH